MKILIVDDSRFHLDAAVAQLGSEHELVVVDNYDEAQSLLGYGPNPTHQHDFDAVLCDLLMPASGQQQGRGSSRVGEQMPLGNFLMLLAAKNATKPCMIGLLTDTNHHDHPASACLDALYTDHQKHVFLLANGSRMVFENRWGMRKFLPTDLSKLAEDEHGDVPRGVETVTAKYWKGLLERLMK